MNRKGLIVSIGGFMLMAILLLPACNSSNNNKTNNAGTDSLSIETPADSQFDALAEQESKYADWKNLYMQKDSTFSMDSFGYSSEYHGDFYTTTMDLNKDFYRKYQKLIVYNTDSSKFIDPFSYQVTLHTDKKGQLYSGGTEADQEVAIVDVKTKKRYRIFFCGPSCFVGKTIWLSNNEVGMFGLTGDNDSNNYTPTIWIVNLDKGITTEYSYSDYVNNITPDDWLDEILSSKGIRNDLQ